MKVALSVLGFVALSALAHAQNAPAPIRLTAIRSQDGALTAWEIPSGRAAALPRWNPETAESPISPAEAARRGRSWLAERNPDVQRFELQSITLSRVRRSADIDFWFYQIDFFGYGAQPMPGGPLRKAVLLPDGSLVEPTRADGGAPPQNPAPVQAPPVAAPTSPDPERPGPGVTIPRAIRTVKAQYTPEALRRKIAGTVLVQGVVGVDGSFRDGRIVKSLDTVYGLDDEALKCASQWRFEPGTKNGQPVPVSVSLEISFYLK